MNRLGDLYRLLRPHAAPHIVALVAVVFLGLGSAMLQKGAYVLLLPTWKILFPVEESSAISSELELLIPTGEAGSTGVEPEGASGADAGSDVDSGDGDGDGDDESAEDDDGIVAALEARFTAWKDAAQRAIIGDSELLAREDSEPQRRRALWTVGIIVAIMALVAAITQYGMGVLAGYVSLRMVVSLRMQLARHLMGLSMRYHTGRQFGDLLSRISSDVGRTTQVVQLVLKDLVQEPLMFFVSIGFAMLIAPLPTLFVLLGLPLFIAPIAILMRKIRKSSHRSATQLGSTFQVLTQMFQGVRTVKAYRAEERELQRFQDTNEDFVHVTMKMVRATTLSRAWTIFFTNFGIAALVVVFGLLVVSRYITQDGGEMLTFFLMISQASSHLKRTTRTIAQVAESQGPAQRLLELLAEEPEVVERDDPVQIESLGDGVCFEGVGFEYPEDEAEDASSTDVRRFSLSKIDLEVRPGETLALVGASGSGKSTLLDLVARFVDPTSGRVTVGGHDLRDISFDSWTAHYALVTQSPFLFHTTIAENIRYGRPDATQSEVEAAARAAHIHEFIQALPEGYETDVRDAGTRLSGGQRQRITIARAILRDPELLLLDEATSALDTESEKAVQAALEEVMVGRTTIVIAHRLSTIRNADRICVLEEGRIVEIGSHDELLERGGVYARLHAVQAV